MRVPVTIHSNATMGEQVTLAELNGLHPFTRDTERTSPISVVLAVGATGTSPWESFALGFTGKQSVFADSAATFFLRATLEGGGPPVEDDSEDFLICARKKQGHELLRTLTARCDAKKSRAKKQIEGAPATDQVASSLESGGSDAADAAPKPASKPAKPARPPKLPKAPKAPKVLGKRALPEESALQPATVPVCARASAEIREAFFGLEQEDAAEAVAAASQLTNGFA